jgi:5'-nucleotidase/UDP-sugar diphosphatase
VRNVRVNGAPLDPGKTYSVAITDFVLRGGDDYSVFGGQRVLISPESGNLLVTAIEKYVKADGTVAPSVDGRITIGR